jgi:hypothetical protein
MYLTTNIQLQVIKLHYQFITVTVFIIIHILIQLQTIIRGTHDQNTKPLHSYHLHTGNTLYRLAVKFHFYHHAAKNMMSNILSSFIYWNINLLFIMTHLRIRHHTT